MGILICSHSPLTPSTAPSSSAGFDSALYVVGSYLLAADTHLPANGSVCNNWLNTPYAGVVLLFHTEDALEVYVPSAAVNVFDDMSTGMRSRTTELSVMVTGSVATLVPVILLPETVTIYVVLRSLPNTVSVEPDIVADAFGFETIANDVG